MRSHKESSFLLIFLLLIFILFFVGEDMLDSQHNIDRINCELKDSGYRFYETSPYGELKNQYSLGLFIMLFSFVCMYLIAMFSIKHR